MSLHLIVGGANAGKTTSIEERIHAVTRSYGCALLLLPSAPDVSRATATTSQQSALGLAVRTFDDFLGEVWQQHGDGRAIAGPAHRAALLEESVKLWQPRTIAAEPASRGLLHLLDRVVQRASESPACIEPGRIPSSAARDLAECTLIYQGLLTEGGFIERAEAHLLAVSFLDRAKLPGLVAIDGFTSFTSAQEMFIAAAAARTELAVTLVHDSAAPATSGAEGQVLRLEALCGVDREVLGVRSAPREELDRVAARLGTTGSAEVAATGAVAFSEAWGGAAEAARIVREAQDALADGITAGQIAVVFRDAAPYLNDLRGAFAEAGIAAEFDARLEFSATPLGRALLLLLRLDHLEHAALVDLLASPYSPTPHEALDTFDARVRARRKTGKASSEAIGWFEEHHPPTAAFLRKVRRAGRGTDSADRQRDWYALVSEMLARARPAARGVDEDLLLDAAAARAFVEAAEALAGIGDALNPTTMHGVLGTTTVALASTDAPDRVQVMGAERIRGRRYRCVIAGGLTDGRFPRIGGEDCLSDPAVIRAFADFGVDLAPRSGLDEERLLFYQVVTRATDRLVLSRQTHDADGRAVRGSVFIDELLDLYRDPGTREWFNGDPPVRRLGLDGLGVNAGAPISDRRALRTAAASGAPGGPDRLGEARRRAARTVTAFSEQARRQAEERHAFSASELETYLQCPFRWCVQRLVQPRELDDRLDAAATGRLGHDIMRRFYDVFPERTGSARVTDELLEEARGIHAAIAAECLEQVRINTAVEAVTCRSVVHRTRRMVENDARLLPEFTPLHHEWSFGLDEDDGPEDLGGFGLVGRIDRMDSDGHRLVLMDYKSGSIGAEHGAVRLDAEGLVQLPLYATVAARRLHLDVSAGVYRSFKGGKPRGLVREDVGCTSFVSNDVVTTVEMAAHLEQGVQRAREAVDRMRQGDIGPDPRGGQCPAYCPARSFCEGGRPGRG